MTKYELETGERSFLIELERMEESGPEELYLAEIDGEKKEVRMISVSPSHLSLLVDNRSHNVQVEKEGDCYRVTTGGESYSFRIREWSGSRQPDTEPRAAEVVITAPMPGLVMEVFARPGEEIEANARLLVLEAMKMQNEISSPRPGRITSVSVNQGDSVRIGDQLVVIE